MAETIVLPARLNLSSVTSLHTDLCTHSEKDVTLDLGQVTYLGALGLQVLIAAARQSKVAGTTLRLRNTSDRIIAQMRLLGACPETIMEGQL